MNLTTSPESATAFTVADLVRASPAAVRILQRHGIDFCCGGKRPLADACALAGVAPATLLDEVADAGQTVAHNWTTLPLPALCATIVARFHAPLAAELPRLQAMVARVLMVHGQKDPDRLYDLMQTLDQLVAELVPHMRQEEAELFDLVQRGEFARAAGAMAGLESEHQSVGKLLLQLRHLTDGFVPRMDACGTWRALYQGLAELEAETHEHIHVENNVLFPAIAARLG